MLQIVSNLEAEMKTWVKTIEAERSRRVEREPRVSWGHLANLLDCRGVHIPVLVENISQSGILLQCEEILLINEPYTLVTRSDRELIEIKWMKGPFAGCEIVRPARGVA